MGLRDGLEGFRSKAALRCSSLDKTGLGYLAQGTPVPWVGRALCTAGCPLRGVWWFSAFLPLAWDYAVDILPLGTAKEQKKAGTFLGMVAS